MTYEEIDQLEGRELDRVVTEALGAKVFGEDVKGAPRPWTELHKGDVVNMRAVPHYHFFPEIAGELIDSDICYTSYIGGLIAPSFWRVYISYDSVNIIEETISEHQSKASALCRTFLKLQKYKSKSDELFIDIARRKQEELFAKMLDAKKLFDESLAKYEEARAVYIEELEQQ